MTTRTMKHREKMKAVMKVWKGERTIIATAIIHDVSVKEIEIWCKTAMRGAKLELEKIS